MWNLHTNRIHVSRDVVWLKQMYYRRQPTVLEMVTGIPSGVRESDSDIVTTDTTPTVDLRSNANTVSDSEENKNENVSVGSTVRSPSTEKNNVSSGFDVHSLDTKNIIRGNESSGSMESESSTSTATSSGTQNNMINESIKSYRQMSAPIDNDTSNEDEEEED